MTHGDGADDVGSVLIGDDGVEEVSLPSYAPSNASAMSGNIDELNNSDEIHAVPDWTNSPNGCSDGIWGTEDNPKTRGGGDHVGNFGLLTANWGGNWADNRLQRHMLRDLKSTPCHLLCLQEAKQEMMQHLKLAVEEDETEVDRRSAAQFIGI